jgi:hypothetical protein
LLGSTGLDEIITINVPELMCRSEQNNDHLFFWVQWVFLEHRFEFFLI